MGTELLHAISLDPRGVLDAGNQQSNHKGRISEFLQFSTCRFMTMPKVI